MADERTPKLRRILIGLMMILIITLSAGIGLLVANWPACMRYFAGRH